MGRAFERPTAAIVALLLTVALGGALAEPAAAAPPGFTRAVSDGRLLLNPDRARRAVVLQAVAATGATVVRLAVSWRAQMNGPVDWSTPEARDPSNPSYAFDLLDSGVRDAADHGLSALLMLFRAPDSALSTPIWPFAAPGTWAPRPEAMSAFATALARRYDGTFPDPRRPGATLPRVRLWQAWNEPNLPNYLQPQWVGRDGAWDPFSPVWYRRMLNAFTAAVKAVQPDNVVAAAGIAPAGEPIDGDGRMTPVRFVHAFLCLRPPPSLRPQTTCPDPPRFDVLAFHPLSTGDPDRTARSRMDVAIADLQKITRPLRAAEQAGWLGSGARPRLWVTELNWETGAAPARVPPALEYTYVARGLERLWRAGAELITWHFLTDPPTLLHGRDRPAGLLRVTPDGGLGAPKRLLRGFVFPLVVSRRDATTVQVWSAPPATGAALVLERRTPAGWRAVARWPSATIVDADVRLARAALLRLRSAGVRSASVRVVAP